MYEGKGLTQILFVEDSAGDALLTGQILAELRVPVKLTIARDVHQALTNPWRPHL